LDLMELESQQMAVYYLNTNLKLQRVTNFQISATFIPLGQG
jgi:hypothetical protein